MNTVANHFRHRIFAENTAANHARTEMVQRSHTVAEMGQMLQAAVGSRHEKFIVCSRMSRRGHNTAFDQTAEKAEIFIQFGGITDLFHGENIIQAVDQSQVRLFQECGILSPGKFGGDKRPFQMDTEDLCTVFHICTSPARFNGTGEDSLIQRQRRTENGSHSLTEFSTDNGPHSLFCGITEIAAFTAVKVNIEKTGQQQFAAEIKNLICGRQILRHFRKNRFNPSVRDQQSSVFSLPAGRYQMSIYEKLFHKSMTSFVQTISESAASARYEAGRSGPSLPSRIALSGTACSGKQASRSIFFASRICFIPMVAA